MEDRLKLEKALKKANTINNYLAILGTVVLVTKFIFSSYEKNLYGFLVMLWDLFWQENTLYFLIGDIVARFFIFYPILKVWWKSLLISLPFGIGLVYSNFFLMKNP